MVPALKTYTIRAEHVGISTMYWTSYRSSSMLRESRLLGARSFLKLRTGSGTTVRKRKVMSEFSDKFDLLTLTDVAELLHCSKAHVGKVLDGRVTGCAAIPCIRLGRRKLVRRESLAGWLEKNEHANMESSLVKGVRKHA